jgi:hypothetical protein
MQAGEIELDFKYVTRGFVQIKRGLQKTIHQN